MYVTHQHIDDRACADVMRRYRLTTRAAVNFACAPWRPNRYRLTRLARSEGPVGTATRNHAFRPPPVVLIDTSAWIEFLRDTRSTVCVHVDELLAREVAICDPIRMEVLAGARDESHLLNLRRLLARAVVIPMRPTDRGCRRPLSQLPPTRHDRPQGSTASSPPSPSALARQSFITTPTSKPSPATPTCKSTHPTTPNP